MSNVGSSLFYPDQYVTPTPEMLEHDRWSYQERRVAELRKSLDKQWEKWNRDKEKWESRTSFPSISLILALFLPGTRRWRTDGWNETTEADSFFISSFSLPASAVLAEERGKVVHAHTPIARALLYPLRGHSEPITAKSRSFSPPSLFPSWSHGLTLSFPPLSLPPLFSPCPSPTPKLPDLKARRTILQQREVTLERHQKMLERDQHNQALYTDHNYEAWGDGERRV